MSQQIAQLAESNQTREQVQARVQPPRDAAPGGGACGAAGTGQGAGGAGRVGSEHAMKTLAEQIGCRCTHFNGRINEKCDAGVVYLTVDSKDPNLKGFARMPCFREGEAVPCEKRHFPTPEEVASEVAEIKASSARLSAGIRAASEDAKKRGFKKGNGGRGTLPCPVCSGGELMYSVAGYNGHIHGKCSTPNCVAWMQ